MLRPSADQAIMFCVIGLVAWAIIGLPALEHGGWPEKPSEWFVALFTGLLVFVTYLLVASTDKLWTETRDAAGRQERQTAILQRAYLSVEPEGLSPVNPQFCRPRIAIRNVGHLPARNIKWLIKRTIIAHYQFDSFPLEEENQSATTSCLREES